MVSFYYKETKERFFFCHFLAAEAFLEHRRLGIGGWRRCQGSKHCFFFNVLCSGKILKMSLITFTYSRLLSLNKHNGFFFFDFGVATPNAFNIDKTFFFEEAGSNHTSVSSCAMYQHLARFI